MGGGGSWNPVEIIENAVSSTGDMLASVDPGPAIGGALAEVDDFVNDEIPGGWALPAAIAVAYMTGYVDPSMFGEAALGEAAFTGATETGLATLAGEGAVADTIGTTLLSGTLEGATAAGNAAYAEALASGASAAEASAAADAAANAYFQGGLPIELTPEMIPGGIPVEAGIPLPSEIPMELTPEMIPEGIPQDPGISLEQAQLGDVQYPGDSQYEVQDLQEQARATDVKPGSPTSWDTGESLIPQELKDAANAINKARQVYGIGRSLLGGAGGTAGGLNYMPYGYGSGITDLSGGTTGGSDLIKNLTPGLTAAKQDYTLSGMPDIQETVTPVHFETGGSTTTTTPEYDPFSTDTTIGKSLLKPALTKAQLNYILTGLPGNLIGKAKGGSIQEHNPEFFSEGGLGSMQNRYVKGAGDGTSDSIPAMLANGEFVIPADVVSSLGNGSNDSGAKILDEFLSTIRKHKRVADAKKLPPDSKGPLAYLLDAKRKVKA